MTKSTPSILEIADALFEFMKLNDVDIPIAMAAFAAALSLMASQLRLPKEEVVKSFEKTLETIYLRYGDDNESMH